MTSISINAKRTSASNDIQNTARMYTSEKYLGIIGWPLLEGHPVTSAQSDAFAKAFAEYLYSIT